MPLPTYSAEWQQRLRAQLDTLPPEARQAVEDHGELRAALRATCR